MYMPLPAMVVFVTGDLTAYTHAVEFENAYFAMSFNVKRYKGLSIITMATQWSQLSVTVICCS